ncbi:hypothetical protein B2J86_04530 [Acidovorax sp. SRB_14]|uniref:zinc ribbon domain-containing protein n=1 Tax=Acidovorax sp. SRB_14 TaxID=1962699 RepID=UPI001564EE9A|nr:hypothetical protein [Acidovorax sp. SRB_14]
MSQMPSLQCLFCQHLNPSDAVFCNNCGGQLNLQPCDRCGAVDLRTATNCYKCGAEFSLPIAPGVDFPFTPAIADNEFTYPTSTDPGVADSEAEHLNAGLTYSHPERQPVDEALPPETSATATSWRRGTPFAIPAILLLLITTAVSVYLYLGHTAQPAQTQGQKQEVIDVSGARKPSDSVPSNGAAGMDAALKPIDTVQTPPASANNPEKTPSLTPPSADAALAARPLPATDAETKTLQDPSVVEKCPPAVATLGLCNMNTQQEKP